MAITSSFRRNRNYAANDCRILWKYVETAATIGLGVYGVSPTAATTWAVVLHIISFIPITLIGAYYFARAGFTMGDIGSAARGTEA